MLEQLKKSYTESTFPGIQPQRCIFSLPSFLVGSQEICFLNLLASLQKLKQMKEYKKQ